MKEFFFFHKIGCVIIAYGYTIEQVKIYFVSMSMDEYHLVLFLRKISFPRRKATPTKIGTSLIEQRGCKVGKFFVIKFHRPQQMVGNLHFILTYNIDFHIQFPGSWIVPLDPAEFAFKGLCPAHIQHHGYVRILGAWDIA